MADQRQYKVGGGLHTELNGDVIQALPVDHGTQANATISSGGAARLDMTGAKIARIAANVDAYVRFGDSAISASVTDMLFPAGVEIFAMGEHTHLSALAYSATGVLTATKVGL